MMIIFTRKIKDSFFSCQIMAGMTSQIFLFSKILFEDNIFLAYTWYYKYDGLKVPLHMDPNHNSIWM